jgi:nucleolar protein 15
LKSALKTKSTKTAEEAAPAEKKAKSAKVSAVKSKKAEAKEVEESAEPVEEESIVEAEDGAEDSDPEDIDDQTAALLKGFESDEEDDKADEGFEAGQEVPKIDKKLTKKAKKAAKEGESDKPGVVYVGRIPHGFYEHEMKAYFTQFGAINRLRLSRNRKTGASRHFAFMEFASADVAEIVAKTMDNYLLFGHILKCKLVDPEQVHAEMWKGSNKRFKKVPWNKLEGRKLAQGMDEAGWTKRIENEEKKRAEKAEKLKAIGYEFKAPKLKSAKDVPKTKRQSLVIATEEDASDAEEPKAIEAPPAEEAPKESASKKSKKGKAAEKEVKETAKVAEPAKGKKAKVAEKTEEAEPAAEKPVKATRAKKAEKAEAPAPAAEPKKTRKRKSTN